MIFFLLKGAMNAHELYKVIKGDGNGKKILRFAILAEAKFNNALTHIICQSNAKKMAVESPEIYDGFSTTTADTLLLLGLPAHQILGESTKPKEKNIGELDRHDAKLSLFEKKSVAELYEFSIRKCNLLKSLSRSNSLTTTNVCLQRRCKNIGYATMLLIQQCEHSWE